MDGKPLVLEQDTPVQKLVGVYRGQRAPLEGLQSTGPREVALLVYAMVAMVSDVYAIFHRPSPYWVLFWFPVGILLGVQPGNTEERAAGG